MNLISKCSKGYSLIFTLLLFLAIACKHPYKKIAGKYPNGKIGQINEFADKNDTLNYVITEYYPSAKILRISSIVSGKYAGKVINYYENGKISQIDSLLHPSKELYGDDWDSEVISFYATGIISQKFSIRGGHINGLSKNYDSRGILVKADYLIKDSIKDGEYREFFDNGQTLYKGTYKNDTLVDTEYYFKENGDTLKYQRIENGHKSMPYKKWLDNGNVLKGIFVDSTQKAVLWQWFDKDGHEIKRQKALSVRKLFISPE